MYEFLGATRTLVPLGSAHYGDALLWDRLEAGAANLDPLYPGIGSLALDAVFTRDVPLVEAFVWTVAILILLVNTGTALIAATIDPRLALAADAPGTAS